MLNGIHCNQVLDAVAGSTTQQVQAAFDQLVGERRGRKQARPSDLFAEVTAVVRKAVAGETAAAPLLSRMAAQPANTLSADAYDQVTRRLKELEAANRGQPLS